MFFYSAYYKQILLLKHCHFIYTIQKFRSSYTWLDTRQLICSNKTMLIANRTCTVKGSLQLIYRPIVPSPIRVLPSWRWLNTLSRLTEKIGLCASCALYAHKQQLCPGFVTVYIINNQVPVFWVFLSNCLPHTTA